jgi:hypothetical protein
MSSKAAVAGTVEVKLNVWFLEKQWKQIYQYFTIQMNLLKSVFLEV